MEAGGKDENGFQHIPDGKLKPFGYDALFDWMAENEEVRQIKLSCLEIWRKGWPWLLGITSVLLLWGIVVGVRNHRQEQARFIAENPQSTQQQIAAATHDMKEEDARKFIDERLTELGQKVETADGDRDLIDKLLRELDDTKAMALSKEESGRLEEMEQTAKVERSRKFKMGIERAYKLEDLETAKKLIAKGFQDNLLLGDDQRWAIETQKAIREKSINDEKNAIASIVINSFEDSEDLNRKIEKILSFQFEDADDAQMAKEASADMKKLLENNVFTITGINVGELKAARKTFIILASGKWEDGKWDDREKLKDNPDMYFHTVVKEGVTQWEASDISNAKISWKPGCSLRLEWISKRRWYWRNIAIASHEIPGGWCSLLEMLQRHTLDKIYKDEEYFNGQKPWVEIACEEFPDPAKSLERIKKFIMPGTYWQQ